MIPSLFPLCLPVLISTSSPHSLSGLFFPVLLIIICERQSFQSSSAAAVAADGVRTFTGASFLRLLSLLSNAGSCISLLKSLLSLSRTHIYLSLIYSEDCSALSLFAPSSSFPVSLVPHWFDDHSLPGKVSGGCNSVKKRGILASCENQGHSSPVAGVPFLWECE